MNDEHLITAERTARNFANSAHNYACSESIEDFQRLIANYLDVGEALEAWSKSWREQPNSPPAPPQPKPKASGSVYIFRLQEAEYQGEALAIFRDLVAISGQQRAEENVRFGLSYWKDEDKFPGAEERVLGWLFEDRP